MPNRHQTGQDRRKEKRDDQRQIRWQLQVPRILRKFPIIKLIPTQDGEDVRGQVIINLNKGKRLDHLGIRVELVGIIENLYDKAQSSTFL